ncbi:MAG: polyprenyl synthetase family protein [Candidatus Azobacteroides sp.]|nr:polyprenyl synthetase family protein [Candidatus Azobacteroides sp.]
MDEFLLLIKKPIENELKNFDEIISETLKSNNVLLNDVIDFVFNKNGKRIRPMLTYLSAKFCGEPNKKTTEVAVSLELLHTASLLHDDVVDDSMKRRGQSSINAVFDNKVAVLAGDFFLASSLTLATETDNLQILRIISYLGRDLSNGEINQLNVSKQNIIDENIYFDVIRQKTAALFAACATAGAASVNASDEKMELMRKTGENIGIIFQIKDDIFDYFDDKNIGKPTGNDIREGKVTLPLIYAVRNSKESDNKEIITIISHKDFSEENIRKIVNFAKENGGVDYAEKVMEDYRRKTFDLLSDMPEGEIKNSFVYLLEYLVKRDK